MREFEIYETASGLQVTKQLGKDCYFKQENCRISFYHDMIGFIELENAMKPGKEIKEIRIYFDTPYSSRPDAKTLINAINKLQLHEVPALIQTIRDDIIELDGDHASQALHIDNIKGSKVFSPFVTVKPIKTPKKWTIAHAWKALLSGQIQNVEYIYHYTDDYAGDAMNNFKKGDAVDAMELARELLESNSKGYRIHEKQEENGNIILGVSHYGYDSKKLVFTP